MHEQVAATILSLFLSYHRDFEQVTWLAQRRFEERDWEAGHRDIARRLYLYGEKISELTGKVKDMLGDRLACRELWRDIKNAFAHITQGHVDAEIAESFFNSLARELFMRPEGVDPDLLFVTATRIESEHFPRVSRRYLGASTQEIVHNVMADFPFLVGYRDIVGDSRAVAERLGPQEWVEVITSIFYRNKGAYIVGRLGDGRPFALALVHPEGPDGAVVDAVMTDQNEISILFSFARQSFRVASPCPYALVAYLKALLPKKPVSELYTAIGSNKHGKTELYRNFVRHLEGAPDDKFVKARGERGMVMACFTLPSYDVVFKIIKDQFGYPKRTTRTKIINCYQLVARHDRLGRMVDAQQFEHLRIPVERFAPELLQELLEVAPSTVKIVDDRLIVAHVYTERRVIPLNLFIHEAPEHEARAAVLDYGLCIKELCASNIFPGDMFLKNFGVTRHGRVVFYDYDEISLVTDCNFRAIPHSQDDDDLEGEAYFYVGPNDVFPEEFPRFVGIPDKLLPDFLRDHGDLFTIAFWEERKARLKAGEWTDVFPYPAERRLNSSAVK